MNDEVKKYKEEYYRIGFIICPALNNENVHFNNYGFNHLIRKRGIRRYIWDTKRRLKLLKYVKQIIQSEDVFVEYRKDTQEFWSLTKTIKNMKIKVIIRRIKRGKYHFFSIFEIKTKTSQT